jgi:hypothetical protein
LIIDRTRFREFASNPASLKGTICSLHSYLEPAAAQLKRDSMPSTHRNSERTFSGGDYGQSVLRDVLALFSTIVESGKHVAAHKISAIAESTRTFGEDMDELRHLQAYTEAAAEGLEDIAGYIDETELADIIDDIGAYARRQPVLTAAVTVAAGIVLTQAIRNRHRAGSPAGQRPRSRPPRRSNGRSTH